MGSHDLRRIYKIDIDRWKIFHEKPNDEWWIARLNSRQEKPEVKDSAIVPFACRSLAFDGELFWSNHRAANDVVSLMLP